MKSNIILYNRSFEESLKMHQGIIDVISAHSDNNGACHLSDTQIAVCVNRSLTTVKNAIKRINREDKCIIYKNGCYYLNYTNLLTKGTFALCYALLCQFEDDPMILKENERILAERIGISRTTIQQAKAYYYAPIGNP